MKRRRAYLIINPRVGKDIARMKEVLAVFSAAGWKTDVALMEFGEHATKLAAKAADAGYDLILAYGGDGTLNRVLNGALTAKGPPRTVGLIPGGTANVWAGEIGVPADPVRAALSLVNSQGRRVDIGHVEVESLTVLPSASESVEPGSPEGSAAKAGRTIPGRKRMVTPADGGRHHFLLMAGLGIDAAIMGRTSTTLKEKIGAVAVAIAAAEELPSHRPFPIEIRSSTTGKGARVRWKGEALQVVVGNTRGYGKIGELTPEANIDDGILDVCVITGGGPLTTFKQVVSIVLHRKAGDESFEHFHGAHLWITVPASIGMQLDGSAVDLKDYLRKADRRALEQAGAAERTMVTYRFDAMPRAARVAIPRAYDDALFEDGPVDAKSSAAEQRRTKGEERKAEVEDTAARAAAPASDAAEIAALAENGRRVKVIGVSPDPRRKGTYVIAGSASKGSTEATKPAAVRVGGETQMVNGAGERLSRAAAARLAEGSEIIVVGKRSKRGVIRAKRVVMSQR